MSDEKFDDLFDANHLKEMALMEIVIAAKQCKENGYPKDKLKTLGRLLVQFKKDFPDAPELEKLNKVASTIIEKLNNIKDEPPLTSPDGIGEGGNDNAKNSIDELFPAVPAEAIPSHVMYNSAIIESKNYYQDNTLLLYSPFEDELTHLIKCYASKKNKILRVVDLKSLIENSSLKASHILAKLFDHAECTDNEIIALVNIEAFAEKESNATALWEYIYKLRVYAKDNAKSTERKLTELFLLSTDLSYGIEAKYNNYIKKEYTHTSVLENYLYNIITDYIPLVSKEKTLCDLKQRFGIQDDTDKVIEAIEKKGIFLGWKGLSDALSDTVTANELNGILEKAKKEKKDILDAFIKISNRGLARFDLLDWDYHLKNKKTDDVTLPDPDEAALFPKFTLKGRIYDDLMSNNEISERLERLMNERSVPLMPKCAWAADFALKGGDQLNLENIPAEKEEEFLTTRWDLAFHAVARLLLVDTPKVVFDIPANSSTGGECCDGGATIRMNKKYLSKKNVDQGINTLLHEFFHSVQHKSERALATGDQSILTYYYYHLNISVYHIRQWKENFSRYRSPENGIENYFDQVVEAEARIFADDAISRNGNINHPRLDA